MSPLNDCSSMRALPPPSVKLKRLLPSRIDCPSGSWMGKSAAKSPWNVRTNTVALAAPPRPTRMSPPWVVRRYTPLSRIVPLKVTSPFTVDASRLDDWAFSMTMSPLVVSAVISPVTLVMRMPSLTVVACTRPLALSTVMMPSTERTDTAPDPPVTRALPCTVSTVTSAVVPSMDASR